MGSFIQRMCICSVKPQYMFNDSESVLLLYVSFEWICWSYAFCDSQTWDCWAVQFFLCRLKNSLFLHFNIYAAVFELEVVCHQVKYLGLMENLRVRRAGFAYRRPYDLFLQRYKSLAPQTWPHYHGDPKEGVDILMKHLGYNRDHYRLGK